MADQMVARLVALKAALRAVMSDPQWAEYWAAQLAG